MTLRATFGQLTIDVPVHLSGTPSDRFVAGLDVPASPDAAITVEASVLGEVHWCEASFTAGSITLTPTFPLTNYRTGQLLRFAAPVAVSGNVEMGCAGLSYYPLLRPDGALPARGQIETGRVTEVMFATDHWILLSAPEKGCPSGTIAITERLCMEVTGANGLFFYAGAERCEGMGGRLCGWDEFYFACTNFGGQLNGLFNSWEWLDDSSNHANSAVQVGLGNCTAQRWANPQSVTFGRARCCFDTR